ncbi:MAG: alanine--glyoxylate aminotransferase family protein [Candidatus Micrarchaeota archaeon]
MAEQDLLMIPGPVTVPKDVLEKMSCQMFNHRGPRYAELLSKVSAGMRWLLGTNGEVHTVTGSGTAGLEFAQVNCIHPNDKVLSLSCGVFGERLADIANIFGKSMKVLEKPYGQPILPEDVEKELKKDKYDVVTCVFNESSTAVKNPIQEIAKEVKNSGAIFIVDNVSGLGMEYKMDEWGVDVTITATQKALGVPPGLSFVALSERARKKAISAPKRSYYFDYGTYKKYLEKGQPPYTPCISAMVATEHVISKIKKAGLENFNALHFKRADAVRNASASMGLQLFAKEGYRSDTLTAIAHPKSEEIKERLKTTHGVFLGGGQKHLQGKVFRIGNMGDISKQDFERVFLALGKELQDIGEEPNTEKALKAFGLL